MPIAARYHEATKYRPESIGAHPGLDWSIQPQPWKEFQSGDRVKLAQDLLVAQEDEQGPPLVVPREGADFGIPELSTLLLHTNGATAVTRDTATPVYFRAAPSAGALYPTEIYVFLRDIEGVEDGIYNFQVRDHSLAPVMEGDFSRDLEALSFGCEAVTSSRCVLLFSAVFFRSAWRYQERAYRRILLDTGHVLGNLATFAPELSLSTTLVGDFADSALDDLLLLGGDRESVVTLAAIGPDGANGSVLGRSAAGVEGEADMKAVHAAGRLAQPSDEPGRALKPEPLEPSAAQIVVRLPHDEPDWDASLCATILSRRSTRRFSGAGVDRSILGPLLRWSYAPVRQLAETGSCALFDPARLKTWISIHDVEGIEPGLYRYDTVEHRLLMVGRGRHDLEDHHVALGQDLARDAAFVVYHSADLAAVDAATGARGYRYLGLDAGHIGQRMNLAALRLGIGVSGIGGYFDDEVNALFGFDPTEAIIYMTCFGQPA